MRQDSRFRKHFRAHFILMGFVLLGMIAAVVVVWAPWN
jgi:hypothetical protein